MEQAEKEVLYVDYCWKCKFKLTDENEEPCETCMTNFVNEYSHKPTQFVEDD